MEGAKQKKGVIPIIIASGFTIFMAFILVFGIVRFYMNKFAGAMPDYGGVISGFCSTTSLSKFASNKNYMSLVNHNMEVYKKAAAQTHVPWQALAAIHYREGSMDPNKSLGSGEDLGDTNPDQNISVGSTLLATAIFAGNHLQGKVQGQLTETGSSFDLLGRAFLRYNRGNGYGYGGTNFNIHPYSMNNYDEQHANMHWPMTDVARLQGRKDANDGALTVYSMLLDGEYDASGKLIALKDTECTGDAQLAAAGGNSGIAVGSKFTSIEQVFAALGGASPGAVSKHLVTIKWLGARVTMNKMAAAAMQQVEKDFRATGSNYVIRRSDTGGYVWRHNVNNPSKLSPHSTGMAVDINWNSNPNGRRPKSCARRDPGCCKTDMPRALTDAMEKNGFFWGAKFSNVCDSMHWQYGGNW